MKITSRTGLSPSPVKKVIRCEQEETIQMTAITRPAPFVMKPFAGLYNPFSAGCSLLCNHPTDGTAKESLRRARDSWVIEGKNVSAEERQENIFPLRQIDEQVAESNVNVHIPQVESVPEELFKRYTETDSRPQTPAPTLASAATRASNSRRCVTPNPSSKEKKEKTLLVLDLRRSHSQETIPFRENISFLPEPPLIRIQQVPAAPLILEDTRKEQLKNPETSVNQRTAAKTSPINKSSDNFKIEPTETNQKQDKVLVDGDSDEEFVRRRGKRKRKKGVDTSRVPPAFQASLDPETQVATIGPESHNPSARHSLAPESYIEQENIDEIKKSTIDTRASSKLNVNSYLDTDMLKQLRRELTEDMVATELNYKRRGALEEALKVNRKDRPVCSELISLQKELKVPAVNSKLWIHLPRSFTRSSAIFELPMDSRTLKNLSPLEYLKNNVHITSTRKLLYNCIFDKFKTDSSDENYCESQISGKTLEFSLNLLMGKPLAPEQLNYFRRLVDWNDTDTLDFKSCCGIFALCERIMASQFCPQLPDRKVDPCHEIEKADFDKLHKKIDGRQVDERLKSILLCIKEL